MYLSGIDDDPELNLDELMNRMLDNYPHEFREYWGLDDSEAPQHLDDDSWVRCRELDRLAQRIAALAASLVRPPKLREDDLNAPRRMRDSAIEARESLKRVLDKVLEAHPDNFELARALATLRVEEDSEYRFFLVSLQLYLVGYLHWPGSLAERVVELTRFAARVRSARAAQYLSRVSRCYVYNMTAELAVMSRATLEAVLEDAIPEDQVRIVRRIPKHLRVGLADYVEVSAGTILPAAAVASARKLKQYGDDAVHVSGELVQDPNEVLEHLVTVLKAIETHAK